MTLSELVRFQLANLSGAAVAGFLAWAVPGFRRILGPARLGFVCIVGIYLLLVLPDVRRRQRRQP